MNQLHQPTPSTIKKTKQRKLLRIVGVIVGLLIILRIVLPYIVLNFVNNRLAHINGYFGHVDDINIALFRGAYVVKDIYIDVVDTSSQKQTPFFASERVDVSIEWKSLFMGEVVSELVFVNTLLRFTEDAAEPNELKNDSNDFRLMLKTFTPIKVNNVEVFGGKIQFIDNSVTPAVDIFLDNAHVLASNLSNVEDTTLLPATIKATADVYEGKLDFNMRINALAIIPTYDLNAEIKNANLQKLNTFFKAYADFDVSKGNLDLYMEIAANDRKYIGYVKPVIKDLDIVGSEDRKDSALRKLWEGLIGVVGDILENPSADQVAAKVPIAGAFGDQTIGVWYAVLSSMRNGFIQAIYPALDQQVSINLVKAVDAEKGNRGGLFNNVFGRPTAKEEKKKD